MSIARFVTRLVALLVVVVFACALHAAEPAAAYRPAKGQIEFWKQVGVRFVVRNAHGKFVTWGIGKLESWANHKHSQWVVRDVKGRFLTNAEGTIEVWDDGRPRIVLRKDGKFIAWAFDNADEIKVDLSRVEPVNNQLSIAVFYITDERFPTLLDHKITVPVWRSEAHLAETLPYLLKVGYRPNHELIKARDELSEHIQTRGRRGRIERPATMTEYEFQRFLFKNIKETSAQE